MWSKLSSLCWVPVAICITVIMGCATYPLVDEAKTQYNEAMGDSMVAAEVPKELAEAKEQFKIIDNLKKNGASDELIRHHAYIAKTMIATAREIAVLHAKQNQLAEAEKENQQLLAEVQAAKTRAAERMAEQARMKAEQVRQRSELLGARLSELEAEKTERGLVINLRNVLFDFGKVTIKPGAEENLAKLSRFLIEYPERKIMIEGFTDNVGPEDANLKLSEQRAKAVKEALVARGVEPDRILTRGYGEADAIADNSTEAGRQQNRRVEIVISDEAGTITERQNR